MPIRAIPWRRPALNEEQTRAVVGAIRELTIALGAPLLDEMVRRRASLYRDYLSSSEQVGLVEFLQSNQRAVTALRQTDLERLLELARPDLMAVLHRDGGRPWLWAQWQEILRQAF